MKGWARVLERSVVLVCLASAACGSTSSTGPRGVAQPEESRPAGTVATRAWAAYGRLCATTPERRLWCMGKNSVGQLGDGTTVDREAPTLVEGLEDVTDVALGMGHSCAGTARGEVFCWGDNALGQLGDGSFRFRLRPEPVSGLSEVVELHATMAATFARREDGSVLCWGAPCPKDYDDTGFGSYEAMIERGCSAETGEPCTLSPEEIPGLSDTSEISAGASHLCAIRESGEMACLGMNNEHQFGRADPRFSTGLLAVSGVGRVRHVATSSFASCALETSGAMRCWGEEVETPLAVHMPGVEKIARSHRLACGVTGHGGVLCAIVHDDEDRGSVPVRSFPLPGMNDVVDLTMDENGVGVVGRDGSITYVGRLPGTPDHEMQSWEPVTASGLRPAKSITAGQGQTCAIAGDGTVSCFGHWIIHEIPGGTPLEPVPGLSDVVEVDVGYANGCARKSSGRVSCWSFPALDPHDVPAFHPTLGDGRERAPILEPVEVSGLSDARQVALLYWHTCAVRGDGKVLCWGLNDVAQLGDGTTENRLTPSEVPGLDLVTQVAVGRGHSCALRSTGEVLCWGKNGNGQLGDGTLEDRSTPVPVKNLSGVAEIAAGVYSTCARRTNGEVLCWGFLGCDCDEGNDQQTDPLLVPDLPPAAALRLNGRIPCVLTDSGEVFCWNLHTYSRDFSPPDHGRSPFRAPIEGPIIDVAPGNSHVCVLLASGEVRCWGESDLTGERRGLGVFRIAPLTQPSAGGPG